MKKNLIIIFSILIGLCLATVILYFMRKASNEVLESFGTINEKFEDINYDNQVKIDSLENIIMYGDFSDTFERLDVLNQEFNGYLEGIKKELLTNIDDPNDYSKMDDVRIGDDFFFTADGYSKNGQDFVNRIATYKDDVNTLFSETSVNLQEELEGLFNNHEGVDDWLDYNFKGFPLIATVTKLINMNIDLNTLKKEILNKVLSQ